MKWINFLHFYQPANIDAYKIKEATERSYKRVVKALEENPEIKLTVNITGCLILRWVELGYLDLIERISKLIKNGQMEITGTAAFHPVMPLISQKENVNQIKENEAILKKYLNLPKKPAGFFIPEMMYNPEVSKLIKALDYKWVILDEVAFDGTLKNEIDYGKRYQDKNSGITIIFRNRELSKSYVPETLETLLEQKGNCEIAITATDGELYGLRHQDQTGKFERILKNKQITTYTISEFIKTYQISAELKPVNSSWESTPEEIQKGEPYILWHNKKNEIQMKLWQLANLAIDCCENYNNDRNIHWARWHLVRGLASCTFWWASARDFKLFSSISWSPDEIERGTNELIRSIRALEEKQTRELKRKAERLYVKIQQMIWDMHWTYYWKK